MLSVAIVSRGALSNGGTKQEGSLRGRSRELTTMNGLELFARFHVNAKTLTPDHSGIRTPGTRLEVEEMV
jgi:hypothetical protein